MITWMQRHKKWLITTIWISTIAFVGAGFVGWGSYDYGRSSNSVAVVGDREISVEELQGEYSALYQQFARLFGEQFNQQMAEQFNLQDQAYKRAIEKNLILSFADEVGLDVTDEEVAKELVKIPAFIKDGKFNKEQYTKILSQNRMTTTSFEESIKRDLLVQKVNNIFSIEPVENEIKNLDSLLFSEDNISIKIIDSKSLVLNLKTEDLKKYWEENKNNYMSDSSLVYEELVVPMITRDISDDELTAYYEKNRLDYRDEEGKIKDFDGAKNELKKDILLRETKKIALKKYLKLKKGEEKFNKKYTKYVNELNYPSENLTDINSLKNAEVLKPFEYNDSYVIFKLLDKIAPKPLSFELAKERVTNDYENMLKNELLDNTAKAALENFNGKNIGFVNRGSVDKIVGLENSEAAQFLKELFSASNKEDYIKVGDKAVVYKINGSRLAQYDESRKDSVINTISSIQNSELLTNLIEKLKNRYEIESVEIKKEK